MGALPYWWKVASQKCITKHARLACYLRQSLAHTATALSMHFTNVL